MKKEKYTQSISIFIPVYNEEANLKKISKEILDFLKKNFKTFEFIIVINVCQDNTLKIAKQIQKKDRRVRLIQQKEFVGYGTQLKTGWENAKYNLIFYTDSDRQFDIKELKKFMKYIGNYDAVIGFREKRQDPLMRIFYSKLYNFGLRFLLRLKFKDMECAFKLCTKKVIDKIKPFTKDRGADAEFILKTQKEGFNIKQLPVKHLPRTHGISEAESSSKGFFVKVKPEIIKALIKEALELRKFKKPQI